MNRRITRREAIGSFALAGGALVAGCGGSGAEPPGRSGSTLVSTWGDPLGDGQLRVLSAEALVPRMELGTRAPATGLIATIAHVTDAHVLDPSSPARVTFLDRLGPPFSSTFRPHETLTAQVLDGAARALRALRPSVVIQGGDLIDNAQDNELVDALGTLGGGRVHPGSGVRRYVGVQQADNPDPFYYRPDVDAPRHPGLLSAARRSFAARGVGAPLLPVLGDHDILVAGELAPTDVTRALALGDRALWELPPGLQLPPGARLAAGASPDGPPDPGLVDSFLAQALAGPTVGVPADPARRELGAPEVVARLRAASPLRGAGPQLDYTVDVGRHVRVIVLDLARRAGGSGGLAHPGQAAWLAGALAKLGDRWALVVSHQPLASSAGGDELLALLDRERRVIAALSGHTHRNSIVPRYSPVGGYWLISTASLIDYPQQARAVRLLETRGGGVAIETWMLDHVDAVGAPRLAGVGLGEIARRLSYLDAQGGRPKGFAGGRLDRNVRLYRRA